MAFCIAPHLNVCDFHFKTCPSIILLLSANYVIIVKPAAE